ncbi:MAG: outer membrane lipoprotein-sorting protein [Gammaproteobacteria bacterium]|nr:outer membrane lipoprotein-sorting protein [Gammaproteobacteria bacterium]
MNKRPTIRQVLGLLCLLISNMVVAADLSDGKEIVTKAYNLERVQDQISRMAFTFSAPNEGDKNLTFRVFWKNYDSSAEFASKVLFFAEFPPVEKDKVYLGFLSAPLSNKKDEEWIYIPDLRQVMRLTAKSKRSGAEAKEQDELFGKSVLHRNHLDPRHPELDTHKLAGSEMLDGRDHYIVESTPKKTDLDAFPYIKTVNWIDKENFTLRRVHFINERNANEVEMDITWLNEKGKWIWKDVVGYKPKSKQKTSISVSKILVDVGLEDDLFSKRSMKKGLRGLKL